MRNIEDYLLDGVCEGCDQDPTQCMSKNACLYEEKRQAYTFYPGDVIFYVTKATSQENITHIIVVRRKIDSRKEILPDGTDVYWLKDMWDNAAGSAPETELFKTKQEALEYAIKKVY